ncbi:MAG: PPC domain-containing protein [Planctomycetaceae bacterium]
MKHAESVGGRPCPDSRALGAGDAGITQRSGRAASGGHDGRHERPTTGHGRPLARVTVILVGIALTACPSLAASPSLSLILPRGVQRGGDRELEFRGARLADAQEILFHGDDGITVASLTTGTDGSSFKAVVHVPESCPAGEQIVQVRTASGITDYRSFWIGILPVIDEAEPNDAAEGAQAVPLGHTVHGIVKLEDVDCYAVDLRAGQRLGVEIEGLRLGSQRFDPHLALLDPQGVELAAADDTPATLQDGVLSVVAPADGRYVVRVREAAYGGGDACRYRMHVGTFPRPTAVFPAGGRAGETMRVTFLGDAAGPIEREVEVPSGPAGTNHRLGVTDDGGSCPNPLPIRISGLGNTLEQEPNDVPAAATAADVTLSLNGVIEKPGDVDHFRFTARKGTTLEVECFARRLRSGLDPVVNVLKADGTTIAGNDDSKGPDSALRFDVPEDGEYLVHVKDHLGRGRPDFVYRVEIQPPAPRLALSIPRIDRFSQTRQTVFVPRGNRYAILVNAARTNVDGELVLDGDGLPAGITMTAPPIKAGQVQVPVVFEAAADAPLAGRLVAFEARQAAEPDSADRPGVRGHFENSADFVLGEPNNAVHYAGRVEKLAVAVIEAVPFSIALVPPPAPLVRNGAIDLRVVVTRIAGFDKPLTVEFPFRPGGVSAAPSITIPPDTTEAVYQINADAKAATGSWTVYAIAGGDVGGTAWVASAPVTLEVAEPFTTATLKRASCEQGQEARIACTLSHPRPFAGAATARLRGLPPGTTAAELTFTQDTPEVVFAVTTTDKSPPGRHKSIVLELVTPVGDGQARMNAGSAELAITKPADAASAPPPAGQQAAAPLSRLEQLRRQAKGGTP